MSEFYLTDKIRGWDRKELVEFCLFCCHKVKHLMNEESFEVVKLVEKWLEDETNVSDEELRKAADAIYPVDFLNTSYYVYAAVDYTAYTAATVRNGVIALYTTYAANGVAYILKSSAETLYLEYMRDRLSDIMER